MSKKTYCDVCGDEMPPQKVALASARMLDGNDVEIVGKAPDLFDICGKCIYVAFGRMLAQDKLIEALNEKTLLGRWELRFIAPKDGLAALDWGDAVEK